MTYPYPWSGDINVDPASVPSPVYATRDANGNVVGLGVGGETVVNPNELRAHRLSKITAAMRLAASTVSSSPPTITNTTATASTIASAVYWPAVVSSAPSTKFTYTGIGVNKWTSNDTFVVPYAGIYSKPGYTHRITFFTDSAEIELRMMNYNSKIHIRADDELVQQANFSHSAAGSVQLIKLVFADARVRKIEVSGYNMPFGGCYTTATGSVWPADDEQPVLVAFGDSYTQINGADGPDTTWFTITSRLLGFEYYSGGVGSSGHLTASPDDPVTRINLQLPLIGRNIPAVLLAFGYNDSAGSQSTIKANCAAAISAIRANAPTAEIIVLGPWTPLGTTANLTSTATSIYEAAAENGANFVSIYDIVNAANKSVYTGVDNVHPTSAGHAYLGQRIAEYISTLIP